MLNGCFCHINELDNNINRGDNNYGITPTARQLHRINKPLTRKRARCESQWKGNIRKFRCQTGQSYITVKGKKKEPKIIKDCKLNHTKCRYKCAVQIGTEGRQIIHCEHWALGDEEKRQFYTNTTNVNVKARIRGETNKTSKQKEGELFLLLFHR